MTGPGDYNVPKVAGTDWVPQSTMRNPPAFTLGALRNSQGKKKPYFPEFEVDFKGKDAPNASKYDPSVQMIKERPRIFTQSKGRRF